MLSHYSEEKCHITRTTAAAIAQFVYERMWLPSEGYCYDEDLADKWLKTKNKK